MKRKFSAVWSYFTEELGTAFAECKVNILLLFLCNIIVRIDYSIIDSRQKLLKFKNPVLSGTGNFYPKIPVSEPVSDRCRCRYPSDPDRTGAGKKIPFRSVPRLYLYLTYVGFLGADFKKGLHGAE